jgi:hypothetical protein
MRIGIASGARIIRPFVMRDNSQEAADLHHHHCTNCNIIIDCTGNNCVDPRCSVCQRHTSNEHEHSCSEGCGWNVPCYQVQPCEAKLPCKACLDGDYL